MKPVFMVHRLKQPAVYWGQKLRQDGTFQFDEYGNPVFEDPVEIKTRWETANVQLVNDVGQLFAPAHRIFTSVLTRRGGRLWKGEKDKLHRAHPPPDNSVEIQRVVAIDALDGCSVSLEAFA